MKYLFITFLLTTSAFASEVDKVDFCESAIARVNSLHRELSRVSAEIVRESGGPEEFISESSSSSSAFNCEKVESNYSILISRRDRIMVDIKAAEQERAYRCPRSRPE